MRRNSIHQPCTQHRFECMSQYSYRSVCVCVCSWCVTYQMKLCQTCAREKALICAKSTSELRLSLGVTYFYSSAKRRGEREKGREESKNSEKREATRSSSSSTAAFIRFFQTNSQEETRGLKLYQCQSLKMTS